MSFGTLVGFIFGVAMVVGSIMVATENPNSFLDIASILIVGGGTVAALFISYETKVAFSAIKLMTDGFKKHKDSSASLKNEIGRLVSWAYILQKNGLQGLENEITDDLRQEDTFLATGADLVVTGYTGAEIRQIMMNSLEAENERNNRKIEALKKMGGDAPAFGMLGTLIGLIIMLGNMSSDPSTIGPSMAVALITTFYGILLARLVFIPLATKSAARNEITSFKHLLQLEGLVLLAERKSPRYIQDKVNSFAKVEEQYLIDRDYKATINQEQ